MGVDLVYIAPVIFLTALHFCLEPSRWSMYAHALRIDTGYVQLLRIFSFTALTTYLLPLKLGLPLRLYLLKTCAGMGLAKSAALAGLDGLLYYGTWGAGALLGLFALSAVEGAEAPESVAAFSWGAATVFPLLIAALYLRGRAREEAPENNESGPRTFVQRAREALHTLPPGTLLASVMVMIIDVVGHAARHWALTAFVGYELPLVLIGAIAAISLFCGLVSMMPMGIGGYDIVLVALLSQAGVPVDSAILVAIVNRGANLLVAATVGSWGAAGLGAGPLRGIGERARSALQEFRKSQC